MRTRPDPALMATGKSADGSANRSAQLVERGGKRGGRSGDRSGDGAVCSAVQQPGRAKYLLSGSAGLLAGRVRTLVAQRRGVIYVTNVAGTEWDQEPIFVISPNKTTHGSVFRVSPGSVIAGQVKPIRTTVEQP